MCGIAGWISNVPERFGPDTPAVLRAMRQALVHRGPDDDGEYVNICKDPDEIERKGSCALGFRRLSIVDLAGGHQPMGGEDGTVQIVFNGEIYNHLDLRRDLEAAGHVFRTRSDTEALVHGWEQWGTGLLPRCNGMFDLAIWDSRQRTLLLARDRYGKKPLFVGLGDGGRTLAFGSELSAVLAHPAIDKRVDPQGLLSLLMLDYVGSPRSIVRDVHTLEPGSFWLVRFSDRGPLVTTGLWHAPAPPDPRLQELDERQALAELDARLHRAVERRLMSDVPLGIFLSGGIDSSLVAWHAARLRPAAELDTFAIAFADPSFDESAHARAVAHHLGTRHHERTLDPEACLRLIPDLLQRIDQPLADPSILPTTFLAAFAREKVTVALGGDGGDEWFLGYPTFFAHQAARAWDVAGPLGPLALPALRGLAGLMPVSSKNLSIDFQIKRFLAGLAYTGGRRHLAWIGGLGAREAEPLLSAEVRQALALPDDSLGPARPGVTQALDESWQRWQTVARDDFDALAGFYARWYLGDGVLQKVDRATMLHSLEARAPLLDPEVVELARALPTHRKLRGKRTKIALRQLALDKLPAQIVQRPKKGFGVPLSAWLRGPLKPWLTDLLTPARLQPWLDPAAVARVMDQHFQGRVDHRKTLWALACFVSWTDRVRPHG